MPPAPSGSLPWRLELLGSAQLVHADGRTLRLDRRTAALLAVLALDGGDRRARLAALLWPGTPDAAARNNLVHLLRKLRAVDGAELIDASDASLRLAPGVSVDALEAPQHIGTPPRPLLAEFEYDDAPDLADWVLSQRETLSARSLAAGQKTVAVHEAAGRLREALETAERLLLADPLSEEFHRAVMRLNYALGDRPAALRAYQRAKVVLRQELGVEPLPETVRLARAIDQGELPGVPDAAIPLSALRPPNLIGRAEEWGLLEAAWTAGRGMIVSGEAGSGKSRLAVDFLRSKTSHQLLLFEGRPGDAAAPYTTHARTYRQVLDAYPDLDLPDWVRRELARIIPTLGEAPPPMTAEADKLRFYEAKVEMIRRVALRGPVILASDDLHYMDEASIEAGGYVFSRFWGDAATNLRTLFAYRSGALSAPVMARIQPLIDAGLVTLVTLAPLDEPAVGALLAEVELPGAPQLSPELYRLTSGNPQFVLEAVKAMFETGRFERAQAGAALSGDVSAVIGGRLARLTPGALHAARAAAVLQSDFSPELVADVLHIGLLDIATAWEELEAAQIMHGERFAHALVLETVLAQIPATARRLLHRSAARTLAQQGTQPARVARQWLEGGDPVQAAPWLQRAAEASAHTLRWSEAAGFYREAAALYAAANMPEEAAAVEQAAERLEEGSGRE
ncbi:ATP-binding protein [Deinococcus ruber]|uniref:Bacterial transcriptional activator domain-containing protein n=1 Tax=Deinococcus ruber TaxID=1848197 RepID=A0A918FEW0_9DEIO|nr:BTAD domain-containing putative transcriptional regulator [Deinococcus ruber]GGR30885.1 hypothetical protein GCM10008957_47000 [Deinococcus ruber]